MFEISYLHQLFFDSHTSLYLYFNHKMESLGSRAKINKLYKTTSFEKTNQSDSPPVRVGFGSTKKIDKDDKKPFVFSLNQFGDKGKEAKTGSNKNEFCPTTSMEAEKRVSIDPDEEFKRKMLYNSESYKEKFQEGYEDAVESNNDLFSMVFLNKAKQQKQQKESVSTTVSFSKPRSSPKIQTPPPQEDASMKVTDFEIGRKLGAGKFGEVFVARHKASGFMCALKQISKQNIDSKLVVQLVRQIKIQTFLNHPNIVKMFAFFADKQYIYLVLELCFSGQLYNYLRKKRKIPEDMAKNIVQQICRALDYMHENEIIHRDLKPENVIYHCGLLKLCDFGWSISTNTMRGTFCGTPLYVSPELLKRKTYNNKIDVWSVGVLTYELLFGRVPFEITTEQDFVKIIEDEIKFSKATKVSDEAKDFILICLEKDPRDRYTLPQLIEHPFLAHVQNVSMAELY